jgi:hypothetical protein
MNSFNKKMPNKVGQRVPSRSEGEWPGQALPDGARAATRPAPGIAACCLLLLLGCSSVPVGKPDAAGSSSSSTIQELNLLSMPMALNLDANPGADGVAVKLFANNAVTAKTVPIAEGMIEILMYDGVLNAGTQDIPPALHVWSYAPQELKPFTFNKSIGTGYDLVLAWGQDQPKSRNVTLIARHVSARGKTVFSGPVTITVSSF